ncbi:ribulose-phosphate 3-epimerase [Thermoanaerobacterium sp. PSU-2]|uniref:ribulose-phosphate 3-epimerase n=1 Tax=Thermoanaerobacterium sp. PSU-2 TaxID=1930849 RepID=UPI000A14C8BE|nr:ribulose-phosphate 3-epimerase [Thermoanaerobacterium sp. PSU-2]ORX22903.1 ribulose-phosphate 3-epimerase [Thermoanaerobacterium sp. PSU-2]
MKEIKIVPSLMCCDFLNLNNEIKDLEKSGVDLFHIDIMDGNFVDNFAMSGTEIKSIKRITNIPLDVHLMVKEPLRYIKYFVDAGADIITVHIEACTHLNRTLQEIKNNNVKVGIALNPGTSHLLLEPIVDYLDIVLIMAVNPGFAGQDFIPSTVNKVKKTRDFLNSLGFNNVEIEVDGHIDIQTIPPLYDAGARIFVAGTAGLFYGDRNYEENVKKLRSCVY